MNEKTCKGKIGAALQGRFEDIEKLWNLWKEDPEAYDPDLGNFNEYGLAFDYVAPGSFNEQKQGYFRYQISYGGPSEEFRFFTDENFRPYQIEFWYLDWFDGAKTILRGKKLGLMQEIFEDFKECGTVAHVFKQAS